MNGKTKFLFIHLEIQDGERRHNHKVLHTTNGKNLDFAVEKYAATYWGYSYRYKGEDWWYAHGGEIAIRVKYWKRLTKREFNFLNLYL